MFKGKELPVPTGTRQHGMPAVTVPGSWCDPHAPWGTRTPLAHHMARCRHPWLVQPCTCMPCTRIMLCIARVPCALAHPGYAALHSPPGNPCTHYTCPCTCVTSPAQTPALCRHPLRALHTPPCICHTCPQRVTLAEAAQVPWTRCGTSSCGHASAVVSLDHRQQVLCPRACPAMAGPCSRCISCLTGVLPCCWFPWPTPAGCLPGDMPTMSCLSASSPCTRSCVLCRMAC